MKKLFLIGLLLISVAVFSQSYSKGFTVTYNSVGIQEVEKDTSFNYDYDTFSKLIISGNNVGIIIEGIAPMKFEQVEGRTQGTRNGYTYQAIMVKSEGGKLCKLILFDDKEVGMMLISDNYNLILFDTKSQ